MECRKELRKKKNKQENLRETFIKSPNQKFEPVLNKAMSSVIIKKWNLETAVEKKEGK